MRGPSRRRWRACWAYLARDLAHLLLQFHRLTTPITRRKLCSRVEREGAQAGGVHGRWQLRKRKAVRQAAA